ncbi:unnamed protein product [Symbiodinium sp. CCMP2592]|nr:unnamed protein product [Symbiodinium sp. CCMP2592]CAE7235730.1 unnamed protein product [Symbiodinium sp. CCMP2592]CAE7235734.1 unnamed protein product [Symbiodinium sp. CCMP2592]CAE7235739.1 unnamed protein product [Symbiodinium sp. CCMP2592]
MDKRMLTQVQLREMVQAVRPDSFCTFMKEPIFIMQLTNEDADSLVENVRLQLGVIDSTSYSALTDSAAIALQFTDDGMPDFYPIPKEKFPSYEILPDGTISSKVHATADNFRNFFQDKPPSNVREARKVGEVKMVSTLALGVSPEQSFIIESPWGSTQTKMANRNAWVVVCGPDDSPELYLCNAAQSGLPLGYVAP